MRLLIPAEKLVAACHRSPCEIRASDLGKIGACVMISVIHLMLEKIKSSKDYC